METKNPVETGGLADQSGNVPIGPSASQTAPAFGGLREGRKRADGLVPGTQEALEADREKARLRKAAYRAKLKAAEPPPPLPAAAPAIANPVPSLAPNSTPVPLAPSGQVAPVPWTAADVEAVSSEVLDVIEEWSVNTLCEKAINGKLSSDMVKDIEQDAHWGKGPKDRLNKSIASIGAKQMNKMGVSAEHKELTFAIASLTSIAFSYTRLTNRMNQLIAAQQMPGQSQKQEKKT